MLSTAIIIFREVFEIVLIVGIILAATRDLPGRMKWISLGVGAGLAGAALVAFFTDSISNFAEGVGQEIFNAGILFVAAAFIGWTVLWMKKHSREMKEHFARVSANIIEGNAPYYALSMVIALAMLREGAEIVLFSYGMIASGQSISNLLLGAAAGGTAGLVIGTLMYMGLVKIPMRYFFRITSGLLILLVAGMISQGMGFLTAAGYFNDLAHTAWDSSWLLSEQGIVGQSLHALIGYTARPTFIQLIAYILTLGVLMTLINTAHPVIQKSIRAFRSVLPALAIAAVLTVAHSPAAHATKKVYSPYVEQGEFEIEWRGGYTTDDDNASKDGAEKYKAAVGYGFTDKWFSEFYAEMEKSGVNGSDYEFTALEWENRFQLTEPGAHWLDAGLYTAYEVSLEDGGADKAEVKLLLAKEVGKFQNLANIILEKELGHNSSEGTEFGIAWSTRYRHSPYFEPGVEVHSNFGPINESEPFDDQKHQIGPVVYGELPAGFKYDIGYLFGVSEAAPDGEAKWIIEYEMRF